MMTAMLYMLRKAVSFLLTSMILSPSGQSC